MPPQFQFEDPPPYGNVEQLSPLVRRVVANNPSMFTYHGSGTFIIGPSGNSDHVAIIDAVWIGIWQSLKIAATADAYQINIAPHNYYGHLATMMNVHFCAAVPNLKIMETDIDRFAGDAEIFTHAPNIQNGEVDVPDRPGWGTEPNEAAFDKYPPL